jgi:raffinose/stachyose/melibiose transport system substrate-binding protein
MGMVFANGAKETVPQTSSGAEGEASGSLVIWEHSYSFEDSLKQVIEGFKKAYPNVKVDYEIKADSSYYSILSTALQSGDGPDLFWTNGTPTANLADYVKNGICLDLTDKIDYGFISPEAKLLGTIDGRLYSVPWMTLDTRTCYYNKTMFKEHGWKVPTTFSEFEKLLADINAAGITPISLAYDTWSLLFIYEPVMSAYQPAYTRGLADYSSKTTDQAAIDTMYKLLEWADKGYFGKNWLGVVDSSAQTLAFTTGKAALNIDGSWAASTIAQNNPDLDFGAFAIPAEDGTTGLVGTSANGFSVNAKSASMDAALAFANYCASKEGQTIWVQSQGAVSASPNIEAATEIAKEISAGGKGNIYTSWQSLFSNYSSTGNASNVWYEDFHKVFDREMTPEAFMAELKKEMK